MSQTAPLKTVLVGCGGMGRNQAKILHGLEAYELTGVCDINAENAAQAAEATGARTYSDFGRMLEDQNPDVVAITTANDTHAPLTIQAARFGVRAVYCEKPMATNLADARAMVEACDRTDTRLVINHQRRLGPDLVAARKCIEAGGIGEVEVVRINTAGDVLSDATHSVDSIQFLFGDPDCEWIFGQVHRDLETQAEKNRKLGRSIEPGTRYGHVVETGAIAAWQMVDGPRVELFCGDMRLQHRIYQDYEIFGLGGRLWRAGDKAPNLFIRDSAGGDLQAGYDNFRATCLPAEGGKGPWRAVEPTDAPAGIPRGYNLLAESLATGAAHPMDGHVALKGFEIVIGIYESARLGARISPPIRQDRFPLELIIEAAR